MSSRSFKQIIREEIKKHMAGGRRKRVPRSHVIATIEDSYSSGRPNVIMDDDPGGTPIGPYPYLNTYTPSAGDRVLMARAGAKNKYVILGKIV